MAGQLEELLASKGMSGADINKALAFGTASFEPESEQARLTAEALLELFAAENAAGLINIVGAAGATN